VSEDADPITKYQVRVFLGAVTLEIGVLLFESIQIANPQVFEGG